MQRWGSHCARVLVFQSHCRDRLVRTGRLSRRLREAPSGGSTDTAFVQNAIGDRSTVARSIRNAHDDGHTVANSIAGGAPDSAPVEWRGQARIVRRSHRRSSALNRAERRSDRRGTHVAEACRRSDRRGDGVEQGRAWATGSHVGAPRNPRATLENPSRLNDARPRAMFRPAAPVAQLDRAGLS
jgi:hypothetical protein